MTQKPSVTWQDAVYDIVHDYPGGAVSLAPRVRNGMSPRVLDNKVNQGCTTHHLSVGEMVTITARTGDLQVIRALAARFDQLLVPVVGFEGISDTALLETYTQLMKELGEFSAVFHNALADNKITRAEIDSMRAEMRDFQTAGEELLNRAEQLVDDE